MSDKHPKGWGISDVLGSRMPAKSRKEWKFATIDGGKVHHMDAIFPIFKEVGTSALDLAGTGFYIARDGIFVTATHCFQDQGGEIPSDIHFMIMHFHAGNVFSWRPVVRAWHSSSADVSVGIAAAMHNSVTGKRLLNAVMTLTAERPALGTTVATYAYAKTQIMLQGGKTTIDLWPRFYDGKIIDYFPNGRDRAMLNWPVWETSIEIHGGASGGPVVGEHGRIFAINTSSLEGHPDVSYITPIDFILDAHIENVSLGPGKQPSSYQIRELAKEGIITFDPPFPTR